MILKGVRRMDEKRKVQEILNHSLSGLKENPFLSQRVFEQGKIEEPVKKKISFALVCIITALLIGSITALAAGVEDINAMLYTIWPEAARALRPLDLSDVKDDIRLEVLSASLTDNELLITYSLTDLKGDRIISKTECDPTVEYPLGELGGQVSTENQRISFDPEKHQAVYAAHSEYASILPPSEVRFGSYLDKVTFTVSGLRTPEVTVTDLWPLMAGQDYMAEAVSCPKRPNGTSVIAAERVPVKDIKTIPDILDPANNLHIPIADSVELSGIGWIDGNMHVQIHVSDHSASVPDEHGTSIMEKYLVYTYLVDWQGNDAAWLDAVYKQLGPDDPYFISSIYWYEGADQWTEYIFPVLPEEMERYTIICEITDQTGKNEELLKCEWTVSFPTNMIRTE